MTVRELLKGSLRLIGSVATGETPDNETMQDSLSSLNAMLDSWASERLTIYGRVREEFSLVAGTQSYTIGTSATFNTSRPVQIEEARLEDQAATPTVEYQMDIINTKEWADIVIKDQSSNIPTHLYMEVGASTNTLYFWPKPSAANKVVLYSLKPFTSFSSLDTAVTFPTGYERAIRYNLALELAPEFGKTPAPEVMGIAMEAKENIKRANLKPHYLEADPALLSSSTYNIYLGE
jgi:hypothetical protein